MKKFLAILLSLIIIIGATACSKTKKLMPGMFDYAKEHQLTITGDPVEFCHIDNYETSNEEEYIIEIQIPVADSDT